MNLHHIDIVFHENVKTQHGEIPSYAKYFFIFLRKTFLLSSLFGCVVTTLGFAAIFWKSQTEEKVRLRGKAIAQ